MWSESGASPGVEHVASPARLRAAFAKVRAGSDAPGVDGLRPARWAETLDARIEALSRSLREGTWAPRPARRVVLPSDPTRRIAIPTVTDRVVQRAVADVLGPWYARRWSKAAFAYLPGRGVGDALAAVDEHLGAGRRHFVRTDIRSFFDRIDRRGLREQLKEDGLERELLALVERIVEAGVAGGAAVQHAKVGVGQGSALSPLLSNVVLRPVDRELVEERGFAFVRYADDMVMLGEGPDEVASAFDVLREALESRGLELSPRKTVRGHLATGFDFLGVRFDATGRRVATSALGALDEVLRGQGERPGWMVESVREFEAWYGRVEPEWIRWPHVLQACLLEAESRADDERVESLAEVRLTMVPRQAWAPEVHLALASVWARVPGRPAVERALWSEAVAVARRQLVDAVTSIATLVRLPMEAVRALPKRPEAALAELEREGRLTEADALREVLRGLNGPVPAAERADVARVEHGVVEALLRGWAGRGDRHAVERSDTRGHLAFVPVSRGLSLDDVREHVDGRRRVALYPLDDEGQVSVAQVELRVRRDAMLPPWLWQGNDAARAQGHWGQLRALALDHALAVRRSAAGLGAEGVLEIGGDGSVRVWFLMERAVPLHAAWRWVREVLDDVGPPPEGLRRGSFPAANRARTAPGPSLVLPLGRHPRSTEHARFAGDDGRPVVATGEWLAARPAVSSGVVFRRVRGTVGAGRPAASFEDARLRSVMAGCSMLRGLAGKAQRLGWLPGDERRTVLESLQGLPAESREAACREVLSPLGWGEREVARAMPRADAWPLSCAKLRGRHATLAAEVGCACVFSGLFAGSYPTPALHAMEAWRVEAFRSARRGRGGKDGKGRKGRKEAGSGTEEAKSAAASRDSKAAASPPSAGGPEASVSSDRANAMPPRREVARDRARVPAGLRRLGAAPRTPEADAIPRELMEALARIDAGEVASRQVEGDALHAVLGVEAGGSVPQDVRVAHTTKGGEAMGEESKGRVEVEGTVQDRVEALLEKRRRIRQQIELATNGLRKVEVELSKVFDEAGADRVLVSGGWLIRVPGDPVRFFLEL